jgi:hypothetical protein
MSIRVSMDTERRMMDVSLHLRAAITLRADAATRKMSEVVKDMLEQADKHQAIGFALMDFFVDSEKSAGSLITPTPDIDLKQLDTPPTSITLPEKPQ